jgi:hypothetical protein
MTTIPETVPHGTDGPTRVIDWLPLDQLPAHPDNPKAHDLDLLASSVDTFGFVEPIVLDERTGYIISGHGRVEHLKRAQATDETKPPPGIGLDDSGQWLAPVVRGWHSRDDGQARAVLVALNRTGERGGWDEVALATLLQAADADALLPVTGFSEADLERLVAKQNPSGGGDSSLLARADVTIGEPRHQPSAGDHFVLADRHHLFVADVMREWSRWALALTDGALFVPYPGPYAALTEAAERYRLVLVQPEPYIAGHCLDKWEAIHGADTIAAVQ